MKNKQQAAAFLAKTLGPGICGWLSHTKESKEQTVPEETQNGGERASATCGGQALNAKGKAETKTAPLHRF